MHQQRLYHIISTVDESKNNAKDHKDTGCRSQDTEQGVFNLNLVS